MRKTQFAERRHMGPAGASLCRKNGQQAHLSLLQPGREAGGINARHKLARGNGEHLVGSAFVGNMHITNTLLQQDFFHGQVGGGADAGGTHEQRARVLARPVEHVGHAGPGAVGGHQQTEGGAGHLQDGHQILDRVPGHRVHERIAKHRDGQLAQGIAVGFGGFQRGSDQGATGAGPVDDDDALAQQRFGLFAQDAQGQVGGTAGWPRHDERQRLDRPAGGHLRMTVAGSRRSGCRQVDQPRHANGQVMAKPLPPVHARRLGQTLRIRISRACRRRKERRQGHGISQVSGFNQ